MYLLLWKSYLYMFARLNNYRISKTSKPYKITGRQWKQKNHKTALKFNDLFAQTLKFMATGAADINLTEHGWTGVLWENG